MKRKIFGLLPLVVLVVFAECSSGKRAIVHANANTNANFGKYKTYAFSSQVDNQLDPGLYFLNDLAAKAMIRDAVEHELGSRGYKKATANRADMVVNFRVFRESTQLTGFTGMGDDYWSGTTATQPDQQTVNVEPGTLMVHVIDKETGSVILQGFASGVIEGGAIVKDRTKIQQATSSVFEEFGRVVP